VLERKAFLHDFCRLAGMCRRTELNELLPPAGQPVGFYCLCLEVVSTPFRTHSIAAFARMRVGRPAIPWVDYGVRAVGHKRIRRM